MKIRNVLFFLVPTLTIVLLCVLRQTDLHSLTRSLQWSWLVCLALLAVVKWFVDSFRLQQIVRFSGGRISYRRSVETFMASVFGSNITPFYAGGIATQIYFLTQFCVSFGRSAAIGVIYALLNLVVNLVFSVVVLVSPSPVAGPHRFALMGIAGVIVALSILAVVFLRSPSRTEHLLRSLLHRRPAAADRAVATLDDFSCGLHSFFTADRRSVLLLLGVSFLSQVLSLLFTPLVFATLGIRDVALGKLLLTQAGVQFSSSIGGTPGGIGIIEGVFALFFRPFAGPDTAAVTLLWRLATYYVPTLVGAIAFFVLLRRETDRSIVSEEETL